MQRAHDLRQSDEDCPKKPAEKGFACDECGGTFQRPILATVLKGSQTQTYYACPRCMTKVQSFKAEPKKNEEETQVFDAKSETINTEPESAVKCEHFFGYLHKHQKDTPFPDECLTCTRMFECMRHWKENPRPHRKCSKANNFDEALAYSPCQRWNFLPHQRLWSPDRDETLKVMINIQVSPSGVCPS